VSFKNPMIYIQVNIKAKIMASIPPHLNMAQRMYFMANKEVKETRVKSKKQIAKIFIIRRGFSKVNFEICFAII
jgi:hypothetical protein